MKYHVRCKWSLFLQSSHSVSKLRNKLVKTRNYIQADTAHLPLFWFDLWTGHIPAVKTNYPTEQKLREVRYLASDHTL